MTIEDPVEWRLEGVSQTEVDVKGGLTFASGLRTILRSDPDVLLVGEVRDSETASIATQAAMKGHLVLTSLYAHNAASAIARLREMGVDGSMLAGSLNAVVAQRLARRLCVHCRREYAANAEELGVADQTMSDDVLLYAAVGCAKCQGTGYVGRVALREVMPVHGEVRALIESSAEEIFAAAVRQGMTTLRDDGMRLALTGVSSVDEIRRVTGIRLI
jgi:type IV pilus assembly protein PilB